MVMQAYQMDNFYCFSRGITSIIYLLYDLTFFYFKITIGSVFTIFLHYFQVIPSGEEPLRMSFPLSIQHLIMKTSMHANEFYGIKFFMHSSPYLERLTVQIGAGRIFDVSISNNFWKYILICVYIYDFSLFGLF